MSQCATAEDVERIAAGVVKEAKDIGLSEISRLIDDEKVMAALQFVLTKISKDTETLAKLVLVLAQRVQALEKKSVVEAKSLPEVKRAA